MYNNNIQPKSFRLTGILFGCFILLFTASLFSIEIGRLYSGSNNYGRNISNETYQYLMYPDTIIGYNGNELNPKLENRWIWPWSTATLLFSLIFFTTGILGIISGQRESYSSILTFFICSLLSFCLMIFLIATYSTIIAGWKSIYGSSSLPYFANIDQQFAIACLVLSIVLLILFFISLFLAGKFIYICTPKERLQVRSAYQPMLGMNTPQPTPRFGHFNSINF